MENNLVNSDKSLKPHLDQIDQIDEVSKRLEDSVSVLEKYFNSLGILFLIKVILKRDIFRGKIQEYQIVSNSYCSKLI